MHYESLEGGREFVARMEHGEDWREEIESMARDEGVEAGWFAATGSVQDAELRYYDQDEFEFRTARFEEPLMVASCTGSVALQDDGDVFAHAHAVLSRRSGQALAGHLDRATVFAGEVYLREFEGSLERSPDDATDLDLWL